MIVKRPAIFIYVSDPSASVLKEICAGIEEEGVFYEIESKEGPSLDELARAAAGDSMLGLGIGVKGVSAVLQLKGLKKGENVESYENPRATQSRNLGANGARIVKRLPLK